MNTANIKRELILNAVFMVYKSAKYPMNGENIPYPICFMKFVVESAVALFEDGTSLFMKFSSIGFLIP